MVPRAVDVRHSSHRYRSVKPWQEWLRRPLGDIAGVALQVASRALDHRAYCDRVTPDLQVPAPLAAGAFSDAIRPTLPPQRVSSHPLRSGEHPDEALAAWQSHDSDTRSYGALPRVARAAHEAGGQTLPDPSRIDNAPS